MTWVRSVSRLPSLDGRSTAAGRARLSSGCSLVDCTGHCLMVGPLWPTRMLRIRKQTNPESDYSESSLQHGEIRPRIGPTVRSITPTVRTPPEPNLQSSRSLICGSSVCRFIKPCLAPPRLLAPADGLEGVSVG